MSFQGGGSGYGHIFGTIKLKLGMYSYSPAIFDTPEAPHPRKEVNLYSGFAIWIVVEDIESLKQRYIKKWEPYSGIEHW